MDVLSFPKKAFNHSIDDDTLNAYVDGLAADSEPETAFEVTEHSAYSGFGTSKFRFLTVRAHFVQYRYKVAESQILVSEGWVERDDWIHVVRIRSPERMHSRYLEEMRILFASAMKID